MYEPKIYLVKPNKIEIENFNPRFYEPNFRFVKDKLEECTKLEVYLSEPPKGGSTPPYYMFKEPSGKEIPFIKTSAISRDFINVNDLHYIHPKYHNTVLRRSITKPNDVIFSMTGKFMGKAALMPNQIKEMNMSQNSVVLRTESKYKSAYLTLFLNSEINKIQVRGSYTISKQKYLNQGKIKELRVVPYDKKLVPTLQKYCQGIDIYYEALNSFKQGIDLVNNHYNVTTNIINRKSIFITKPKMLDHEILTPEYYCHDYRRFLEHVFSTSKTYKKLDYYVTPQVGSEIGSDNYSFEGIPFIKTSDIMNYNVDYQPNYYCSDSLFYELEQDVQYSDILLAKDGKIGEIALITDDSRFVYCGGLVKLQSNNLDIQIKLFTILASMVGQVQLKMWSIIASTMAHLRHNFFSECIIPDLDKELEDKILGYGGNGIKLRKTATKLITTAKKEINEYFLSYDN
ncbi:MAG: restriction endonuclease subunit S domain-containing protein [Bacillota bacterium]